MIRIPRRIHDIVTILLVLLASALLAGFFTPELAWELDIPTWLKHMVWPALAGLVAWLVLVRRKPIATTRCEATQARFDPKATPLGARVAAIVIAIYVIAKIVLQFYPMRGALSEVRVLMALLPEWLGTLGLLLGLTYGVWRGSSVCRWIALVLFFWVGLMATGITAFDQLLTEGRYDSVASGFSTNEKWIMLAGQFVLLCVTYVALTSASVACWFACKRGCCEPCTDAPQPDAAVGSPAPAAVPTEAVAPQSFVPQEVRPEPAADETTSPDASAPASQDVPQGTDP